MANPFSAIEQAALLWLAGYAETNKAKIVAAVVQPVQYGIDDLIHFLQNAEPKNGVLANLIDGTLNAFLNSLDASVKAQAPTEVGAIVDWFVAQVTRFANAL